MLRIGDRYDISRDAARQLIQRVIDDYGVSKDINDLGRTIACQDAEGNRFSLVILHRTPDVVAVCGP